MHTVQMTTFLQAVILGAGTGAIDGLLAMSIVLIYRTTGVLNFAQGTSGTFAAFVIYTAAIRLPLWLAVPAGLATGAALTAATDRVVSGMRTKHFGLSAAVATLGIAILLQQAIRVIWGTTTGSFPSPIGFGIIQVGTVTISYLAIWTAGIAVLSTLALAIAHRRTAAGTMIRAIADNPVGARLCGGNVRMLVSVVWGISGVLAAAAGFFAAQLSFDPALLDPYFVAALIAAVIGGLRNLGAALVGAVAIETARNLLVVYAPNFTAYTQTTLVLILIAVLVFAPRSWLTRTPVRVV